jgi:DNA-directed RNA polymerase specialized sigma24 family protein
LIIEAPSEDIVALDEALNKLEDENPDVAELVKIRYFAGMSLSKAADILCISQRTAARYWAYARVWLLREITKPSKANTQ